MAGSSEKILSVSEIGAFFGVAKKTVWEWCKSGKIPAFKIGKEWKVRQVDLQRLINQKVRGDKKNNSLF